VIKSPRALTYSSYAAMLFLGVAVSVIGSAARQMGLDPTQIGLLISIQSAGFAVGVVLTGSLADTYPKPRLLMVGSLILGIGFLAFYRTPILALNCPIMFLIGCGTGNYEGVTDAMLIDIHPDQAARHININHAWVTVGKTALAIYLLILTVNWRASLTQSGLIVLGLAAFFALAHLPVSGHRQSSIGERLAAISGQRPLAILFAVTVLAAGIESGTGGIMTSFLADLRGFTTGQAQLGLIIFLLGTGTGRFAIGLLTRSGRITRLTMLLFVVCVPIYAVLFFLNLGPLTWPAIFIAGLGLSACLPLALAIGGQRYPEMSGTVLGALKVGIPAGGIVVPSLMSLIVGLRSFQASLAVFPLAFLLGSVLLWAFAKPVAVVQPAGRTA
jgi:MFS family permease